MKSWMVAAVLMLSATSLWAGYKVQVNAASDLRQAADSVAVAPIDCPGSLDCLWVEEKLAQELATHGVGTVIPAERVRRAMFELGLSTVTEEARSQLAAHLGVRAFAIPVIRGAEKRSEGAFGFWTGNSIIVGSDEVTRGSVELLVVSIETGRLLLHGSGSGRSEFRGQRGVVLKIFREILDQAFL